MDLPGLLLVIGFEALIALPAALLVITFVSFSRMEKDVRRARMFIMADRIKRFLGAFTVGFVVLAVSVAALLAFPGFQTVFVGAFFFFLGTIAYGIVELFLIVRPRQSLHPPNGKSWPAPRARSSGALTPRVVAPTEDDRNAGR
jgi:hypothetical protein